MLAAGLCAWQASSDPSAAGGTVTIHLGQLKAAASASAVLAMYSKGRCWALVRMGATEGTVESCALHDLPALLQRDAMLLQLWPEAVGKLQPPPTPSRRGSAAAASLAADAPRAGAPSPRLSPRHTPAMGSSGKRVRIVPD